jgi:hypothetical protein
VCSLLIRLLALVSVSREEEEEEKKNSRIIENRFVNVKTLSSRLFLLLQFNERIERILKLTVFIRANVNLSFRLCKQSNTYSYNVL